MSNCLQRALQLLRCSDDWPVLKGRESRSIGISPGPTGAWHDAKKGPFDTGVEPAAQSKASQQSIQQKEQVAMGNNLARKCLRVGCKIYHKAVTEGCRIVPQGKGGI